MATAKTEFTVTTFTRLAVQRDRMNSAMRIRKEMLDSIKRGEFTHPRLLAIEEMATMIEEFCSDIAKEYDKKHPNDYMLNLDVRDALFIVRKRLNVVDDGYEKRDKPLDLPPDPDAPSKEE